MPEAPSSFGKSFVRLLGQLGVVEQVQAVQVAQQCGLPVILLNQAIAYILAVLGKAQHFCRGAMQSMQQVSVLPVSFGALSYLLSSGRHLLPSGVLHKPSKLSRALPTFSRLAQRHQHPNTRIC